MAGALDGIRVIDFGQWLAGPLAALLLADQGAEVIHVDPPGGPAWKTVANATLQRGKQRIVLDLKSTADLASARGLISSADVVIENFRPGVMDRWDSVGTSSDAVTTASSTARYPASPPMTRGPQCRRGKACWLLRPGRTPGAARRISPASMPCLSPLSLAHWPQPSPLSWPSSHGSEMASVNAWRYRSLMRCSWRSAPALCW